MSDPPKPPVQAPDGATDEVWNGVEQEFFAGAPPDMPEPPAEPESFDDRPPMGVAIARNGRRAVAARALAAASAAGAALARVERGAARRAQAAAGRFVAVVSARRLDGRGVAIAVASAALTLGLAAGVLPARNDARATSPATTGAPTAGAGSASVMARAAVVAPAASVVPAAPDPGARPSLESQRQLESPRQRSVAAKKAHRPDHKLAAARPARAHKESTMPALARPPSQRPAGRQPAPRTLVPPPVPLPAPAPAKRPLFSREPGVGQGQLLRAAPAPAKRPLFSR